MLSSEVPFARRVLPLDVRRLGLRMLARMRGTIDAIRIARRVPELRDYERLANLPRSTLHPLYQEYVTTVSNRTMAVSFELAVFLTVLSTLSQPKRVLDLGSGFSSLVLRKFAREAGGDVAVWSVDDSPLWLEATRRFLDRHGMDVNHLLTWDEFEAEEKAPFDLVLYDLGTMDTRAAKIGEVLPLVRRSGLLVLDDLHVSRYAWHVRAALQSAGLRSYSLMRFTLDEIGRFSMLVLS